MATRRAGNARFDHGAQYFTVRDRRFAGAVQSWSRAGVVASWDGRIAVLRRGFLELKPAGTRRLVAVPGMSALCGYLAVDLDVVLEARVSGLRRLDDGWSVETEGDRGAAGDAATVYDAVVVSSPAPQTAELLREAAPRLAARASTVEMSPCWAAMVSWAERLDLGFDGAFVEKSPLSWVARSASRPGRPDDHSWVLHGSPEWSRRHLELDRADAAQRLVEAFRRAADPELPAPRAVAAHRWRYALPEPLPEDHLFDPELWLAACGDWCGGPRVEGAFLSGLAAAEAILGQMSVAAPGRSE